MASQDLFQPHLRWFCAFISDSLVRVFKPLNVCPAELTGSLGLTFASPKPSGKEAYQESTAAAEYSPLTASLPPAPQAGESRHPSVLNAFCVCWGGKDSISSWPNDKVFALKIPPI